MKTYYIRVRKECVGCFKVEAEDLNKAEIKAENFLAECSDELCASVDFYELSHAEFVDLGCEEEGGKSNDI